MKFGEKWQIQFVQRTLDNLNKATASAAIDHEATLLVNSMLGLLVLPLEKMIAVLPDVTEHDLPKWGIKAGSIECFGNQRQKWEGEGKERRRVDLDYGPKTLKGVVHSLRNALCHIGIEPIDDDEKVVGFKLKDWDINGFTSILSNESLKELCEQLAAHLVNELDK